MDALTYLQAFSDHLDSMHGKRVKVTVEHDRRDFDARRQAEEIVKILNRKGGPKISSSAIV